MDQDGTPTSNGSLGSQTNATAGESLEIAPVDATQNAPSLAPAQSLIAPEKYAEFKEKRSFWPLIRRILLGLLVLLIILAGVLVLIKRSNQVVTVRAGNFDDVKISLSKFASSDSPSAVTAQSLLVNGQLNVSNSLVLTPSVQPSAPLIGEIYYDQTTNQLAYFNGSQFINLVGSTLIQNTTTVTTINNILSGGGSVTTVGGTAGVLPKFIGPNGLGASIASDDGITLNVNGNLNLVSNGSIGADINAFPASATPVSTNLDPKSVELGVKFKTDVSGLLRGVRFYKPALNTGVHTGSLWTASGTLLAQATFTGETASGWQEVRFATPVAISADTTYVASYHDDSTFYAVDLNYFRTTGVSNGPLHLLQNGDDGANGVFKYNATSAFPTTGFNESNYWVDVVFAPNPAPNRFQVNGVQISSADLLNNTDLAKRGASQIFTGTNTFRNTVDSESVFSVQSAAGNAMLSVDTANARIVVGPTVGDNTGTVLVLGVKNNLGDPGGVEGSIYYNNALRSFRCFRFGQWDNCASLEVDHSFSVYDEFLGGQTTTLSGATNIGSLGWNAQAIGANGSIDFNPATPTPVADRPGVLQLTTPGVINQGTTLVLANGNGASMLLAKDNVVKTSVAVGAATGQTLRVGLDPETTSTTRPVSGVWFEANPASNPNWQYCYGDGLAATCTASGVAIAANSWVTLEIRVLTTGTGTSAITFIINGTFFALTTKTVDTTTRLSPAFSCFATTASPQNCYWDYFQLKGTTLSTR